MKRIHLIHTNDLHSHLEPMAQVDAYVRKHREIWANNDETGLLIDIGDHLDRVRMETEGTDGLVNRAILETSGYDVVTLGNNELLTFSREELMEVYRDASFQVVCSNVDDALFQDYYLYEKNGVKLAFIGATIHFEALYKQLGWQVKDPLTVLRNLVTKLRADGYIILLLSHLGYDNDVNLALEIPEIDLIMGGHTHHILPTPEKVGQTTLAAAGKYGQYLGHLTLECTDSGQLLSITGSAFPLQERPSEEIMSLIDQYQHKAIAKLSEPVVSLIDGLSVNWDEESSLANLLADSLVNWTGAKYSFVNSGQLLDSLPSGTVTKQTLHAICPHPINPVILSMSGKDIRLTLEQSLLAEYKELEIRGFGFRGKILGSLAISGMKVIYDPTKAPFQKIKSIYMGEEVLVDEKVYEIATISMLTFGVGYSHIGNAKVLHYFLPEMLRDVLLAGLHAKDILAGIDTNRWITVSAMASDDDISQSDR